MVGRLPNWKKAAFVLGLVGLAIASDRSPAMAAIKTAVLGDVRAEFAYEEGDFCHTNGRLTLTRAGKVLIDRPLSAEESESFCRMFELQVVDLEGDGEPEAIADIYSGGAHCCLQSFIYRYDPTRSQYASLPHFWGNGGYRLKDLNGDGILEFYSRDDRFAYAFASYAGSRYPLQIWTYQQGRMVDVTRNYPQLVYAQAYALWQDYQSNQPYGRGEPKGVLAAYLASKYLLGQGEEGWRLVRQLYREGDRDRFFSDLQMFLQETGYIQ